MSLLAFTPNTSLSVQAGTGVANVGGRGHYLRLCNAGPGNISVLFFELGTTPPAVDPLRSMLILGGAIEVFSVASDTTQVAYRGDGAVLNITRGEGQ